MKKFVEKDKVLSITVLNRQPVTFFRTGVARVNFLVFVTIHARMFEIQWNLQPLHQQDASEFYKSSNRLYKSYGHLAEKSAPNHTSRFLTISAGWRFSRLLTGRQFFTFSLSIKKQ